MRLLNYDTYKKSKSNFCIFTNFDNPIKACFSIKKYLVSIETRPTQIANSIFLIESPVLSGFLGLFCSQKIFFTEQNAKQK